MKAILLAVAASLLYLPASSACGQGIVPSYHFKNIAENTEIDDERRQWANQTYWHMQEILGQRVAADGDGITDDDDDSEIPDEQNPDDEAALAAELAALDLADEGTPDPDATGEPSLVRRRRGARRSPQLHARAATPDRFIYNDYNVYCDRSPPRTLVRKEGTAKSSDNPLNIIYDGLGNVFNLYQNVYGRNSFDGAGGRLHGTGGYCKNFANALWDGRQMLFGNGDGYFFNYGSFVASLDVIGHEVTHGVIQNANPLFYSGQAGALNEHLADVFGILTSQYTAKQMASDSNWLIGNGIPVGGGALRSMKAPGTAYNTRALGKDPQPETMSKYYSGQEDNYGVHINSGIPNRAFYLFATAVGGYAYDTPGRIWYNVLSGGQGKFSYRDERFANFAQRTINAANELYSPSVADKLQAAWKKVEVL